MYVPEALRKFCIRCSHDEDDHDLEGPDALENYVFTCTMCGCSMIVDEQTLEGMGYL